MSPSSFGGSATQATNDGQTRGIPIGPDTSLVLAEIPLAGVDDALIDQFGPLVRGYRYVDDYELSCVTLSDAEALLTALQGLLGEHELLVNPRKTSLIELPAPLQDNWSVDLSKLSSEKERSP